MPDSVVWLLRSTCELILKYTHRHFSISSSFVICYMRLGPADLGGPFSEVLLSILSYYWRVCCAPKVCWTCPQVCYERQQQYGNLGLGCNQIPSCVQITKKRNSNHGRDRFSRNEHDGGASFGTVCNDNNFDVRGSKADLMVFYKLKSSGEGTLDVKTCSMQTLPVDSSIVSAKNWHHKSVKIAPSTNRHWKSLCS